MPVHHPYLICPLEIAGSSCGKDAFFFPFAEKAKDMGPDMWIHMTEEK